MLPEPSTHRSRGTGMGRGPLIGKKGSREDRCLGGWPEQVPVVPLTLSELFTDRGRQSETVSCSHHSSAGKT